MPQGETSNGKHVYDSPLSSDDAKRSCPGRLMIDVDDAAAPTAPLPTRSRKFFGCLQKLSGTKEQLLQIWVSMLGRCCPEVPQLPGQQCRLRLCPEPGAPTAPQRPRRAAASAQITPDPAYNRTRGAGMSSRLTQLAVTAPALVLERSLGARAGNDAELFRELPFAAEVVPDLPIASSWPGLLQAATARCVASPQRCLN